MKYFFKRKINKAQRKYNKETIKDIKNIILKAIETAGEKKNCILYPTSRLNDNIIKYFETFGIEVSDTDCVYTKFSW